MEAIIRNGVVEFSELTAVVGVLDYGPTEDGTVFTYTATEDGKGYGSQLLENWFVAYNERLVHLDAGTPENVWSGTIKTALPKPVAVANEDGSIDIRIGNDTPMRLVRIVDRYSPDTYRVEDTRLCELSKLQFQRRGNWSYGEEFQDVMRDLYPNYKTTKRGLLLGERMGPMETLPVSVKTTCLSVGEWAIEALDGHGCVSERGTVLTMTERTHRERRKDIMVLDIVHALRFDITDGYVREAYSKVLGYPATLELLHASDGQRRYQVATDYEYTALAENVCPVIDEHIVESLHSNIQANAVVTLSGLLPALSYLYEERKYVLMPLPVVGELHDVAGHVMVQVDGRINLVNGWVDELGTLIIYDGDASTLGIEPIVLQHTSVTYFNQVMFGMITTADHWDSLVRIVPMHGTGGITNAMNDALDDRRESMIGRGRGHTGRSRERVDTRPLHRDRGGRGR